MILQVKKTDPNAIIPTRAHPTDAGLDLTVLGVIKILDDNVALFDTGIAVTPPDGYYTEVVLRSSASKLGISLANGTGIIDPAYTGSIMMAIRFHKTVSLSPNIYEPIENTCIGQLLVKPLILLEVEEVEELTTTVRGDGGFGSTGR
jgi:dUTP pyrophosphatase